MKQNIQNEQTNTEFMDPQQLQMLMQYLGQTQQSQQIPPNFLPQNPLFHYNAQFLQNTINNPNNQPFYVYNNQQQQQSETQVRLPIDKSLLQQLQSQNPTPYQPMYDPQQEKIFNNFQDATYLIKCNINSKNRKKVILAQIENFLGVNQSFNEFLLKILNMFVSQNQIMIEFKQKNCQLEQTINKIVQEVSSLQKILEERFDDEKQSESKKSLPNTSASLDPYLVLSKGVKMQLKIFQYCQENLNKLDNSVKKFKRKEINLDS